MRKVSIYMVVIMECILLCTLNACNINQKKYYSNRENYINVSGIIEHIEYNQDSSALYIGFSDLSPTLDDTTLKLVGENLKIAQANGIDSKLQIGDRVTFITAPKYFGDGYVMPIASITVDGEVLLEFEEGYANLQDIYS